MTEPFFDEIRAYVDFGPEDSALLKQLVPALLPVLDELVEDFYGEILRHAETRRVLADDAQLARLKLSLREWARSMVEGPHDVRWFELRSRIGRRHVEVGLPQRFVPLALARVRRILARVAITTARGDIELLDRLQGALHKVLGLEVSIMLESYFELHSARVRQAERLGSLGQLAASVSHELKNPLGVINTSLHLLQHELSQPPAARDDAVVSAHLVKIGRGSRQAARMASQLLDFARTKQLVLRRVALAGVLEDGAASVDDREGVAVDVQCEPADSAVLGDAGLLAEALANLVRNAVQAIRESGVGGKVMMRGRRDPLGVSIMVSDDGPGIAPDVVPRIFEPLFTTRSTGTGLGLAIARDIVEAHHGQLTVNSTPGRGAVFTVHLPQAPA